MSSSPDPDLAGADGFPEIPRPAALWPLATVAFMLGMIGIYLMLPRAPGPAAPARPAASRPAAPGTSPAAAHSAARLVLVDSEDSTFAASARSFAKRAEALSDGRLRLEILAGGRVDGKKYGELALMRLVQAGDVPMGVISMSPLTNLDPRIAVLDLPFLFESYAHADRVLDGPLGRDLLEGLKPRGLVGLGYMETGFRIFSSSLPLPTLKSMEKRRIRVMQSATYMNFVRALDAEPVPSAVDRIYEMGRQGFIDAADRSYPTYWDFRLYEVQRYITETNHAYATKAILVNRQWFEALPLGDREALQKAAHEAERAHRESQRADEAQVKQKARDNGIEIFLLSEEERARFVQRVQPLYEEFNRSHGPDLVQRIRDLGSSTEDVRAPGTDEVR